MWLLEPDGCLLVYSPDMMEEVMEKIGDLGRENNSVEGWLKAVLYLSYSVGLGLPTA